MSLKFEDFIRQELTKLDFKFSETRKNFVMNCIRGHDKATQSLGIRKSDGVCHCFGCGESWSWNRFASEVKAAQIDPQQRDIVFDDPFSLLVDKQKELEIYREGIKEPAILEEWYGEWRGFSESFLKSVPTYLWWDTYSWEYGGQVHRAFWRVTINGQSKGYVARRLDNEKIIKYKNASGMSSTLALFPYDFCPNTKCVVLVEGPVDALRLLSYDIPALAVLGTNNWDTSTTILLKTKGIEHIVLCGDGDNAGRAFSYSAYNDLLEDFTPSIFPCEEGQDPGSMEPKHLKILKRIVDKHR